MGSQSSVLLAGKSPYCEETQSPNIKHGMTTPTYPYLLQVWNSSLSMSQLALCLPQNVSGCWRMLLALIHFFAVYCPPWHYWFGFSAWSSGCGSMTSSLFSIQNFQILKHCVCLFNKKITAGGIFSPRNLVSQSIESLLPCAIIQSIQSSLSMCHGLPYSNPMRWSLRNPLVILPHRLHGEIHSEVTIFSLQN